MVIILINNYEIKKINGENVLILHFNYNYEFGSFNKNNNNNILKQVKKYINDKKILFSGTKIVLMVTGIVVGTLFVNNNLKDNNVLDYNYVDKVILNDYSFNDNEIVNNNELIINLEEKESTDKIIENNNSNTMVNNKEIVIPNKQINIEIKTEEKKEDTPIIHEIPVKEETKVIEPKEEVITYKNPITIKRSNGVNETIEFNDYIIGVVAAEMPASFNIEALKTQAIIARTYYKKNVNKKIVTDNSSFQNYIDINGMKNKWGADFDKYYNKIKDAVISTDNIYITYNGSYIDAVYFATSNGYTQDASEVWGYSIPYLKSVDSSYDINTTQYLKETTKSITEVNNILNTNITNETIINIEKNSSNYVSTISIDNYSFTGKEFREKLNLRSTDFDIVISNDNLIITTRGYGHGVGLSQYGAGQMANQGYNYEQIIKHYYTGVSV